MIPRYIPILNGQLFILGFVQAIQIFPEVVCVKGLLSHSKLVVDMFFFWFLVCAYLILESMA